MKKCDIVDTVVREAQVENDNLPKGWERKTFIVRDEYWTALKYLSKQKGKSIKDTLDEILLLYIKLNKDLLLKEKAGGQK